jgi:alpha-mannosidase
MSWALNNHWLVNFKSSQSGRIPLRYRLTTHEGPADAATAARFAAEQATPVVALRDIAPMGQRSDSFLSLDSAQPVLLTAKPGEEHGWVALRLQNLSRETTKAAVRFTVPPRSAMAADPVEHPREALPVDGNTVSVDLRGLEIRTVLIRFAAQLG